MRNHPSQKGIRSDLDKKCLKWTFSNRILQQEKTSFKNGPRKSSISITFWVPHLAPGLHHHTGNPKQTWPPTATKIFFGMITHSQTVSTPCPPHPGNHILQYPSHCSILNVDTVIVVLDFNPPSLRPGGKKKALKDNFWGPNVPPNLRLRAQKNGGREGGVSPHFSAPLRAPKKWFWGNSQIKRRQFKIWQIVGDNFPLLCSWYWLWNSIGERVSWRNTEMHNHPSQKGIRSDLDKKCLKWTFSNRILQQEKTSFKNGPRKSSISITFWVPHLAPGPPSSYWKSQTNLATHSHQNLFWDDNTQSNRFQPHAHHIPATTFFNILFTVQS